MLELNLISLSSPNVSQATAAERAFLLAGGHLQNEVVTLNKLFVWTIQGTPSEGIAANACGCQSMTIARLLAGKLSEGWRLLSAVYFGARLSDDPNLVLEDSPTAALGELKRYFSKKNSVDRLRNDFAFHYSADKIAEQWEELSKEPGFDLIIGDTFGNTYHRGAEFAANLAMLRAINVADRAVALQMFFDDVQKVAKNFNAFVDGVIHVILARLGAVEADEKLELNGLLKFSAVSVPFFTEMPK